MVRNLFVTVSENNSGKHWEDYMTFMMCSVHHMWVQGQRQDEYLCKTPYPCKIRKVCEHIEQMKTKTDSEETFNIGYLLNMLNNFILVKEDK